MEALFAYVNETMYSGVLMASDALWSVLVYVLVGSGIYFTIRLRCIQIRKFPTAIKQVYGNINLLGRKAGKDGMSSFQALATAVAAQVGTGNLAGAATALISGGPGAVFWIWVSAFFGMSTIYAEAVLAQKTRKTLPDGRLVGGPVYYIKNRFTGPFGRCLAALFAIFIVLALGFMGNMVQSNSISAAFAEVLPVSPIFIGAILAVFSAFIFLGGVKRIVQVIEKVVPTMVALYILGCIIILVINITAIPKAFADIIIGAFNPTAVIGAGIGITVKQAVRYGVARGLFSNEAGMGSTPNAHALARVAHPVKQGYSAMVGVFVDTFIILTMTTLVLLVTNVLPLGYSGDLTGVSLTQAAFETNFGFYGKIFIALTMLFFAFSTIMGWYFFGQTNVRYLFGNKAVPIYSVLVVIFIFLGSGFKVDMVWLLADFFNGLMVIPNLIGLVFSGGIIYAVMKDGQAFEEREEENTHDH